MRPQLAVNIMKVEFPEEITAELNDHVDTVIIPNNKDFSKGLVGQINRNEKSKQLTFPHLDDNVGLMCLVISFHQDVPLLGGTI